jgi:hypothetical protein
MNTNKDIVTSILDLSGSLDKLNITVESEFCYVIKDGPKKTSITKDKMKQIICNLLEINIKLQNLKPGSWGTGQNSSIIQSER